MQYLSVTPRIIWLVLCCTVLTAGASPAAAVPRQVAQRLIPVSELDPGTLYAADLETVCAETQSGVATMLRLDARGASFVTRREISRSRRMLSAMKGGTARARQRRKELRAALRAARSQLKRCVDAVNETIEFPIDEPDQGGGGTGESPDGNEPGVPPCVDSNADGTINSNDISSFLVRFAQDDADFNHDGATDRDDIVAFLAAFLAALTDGYECIPPPAPTPPPGGTHHLSELLDCWQPLDISLAANRVYVSSSQGNDANSGASTAAPVRTIRRAFQLVQSGGWILLKRGDTFAGTGQSFGSENRYVGGLSAERPLVLTSYGSGAMPVVSGDPAYGSIIENWRPTSSYWAVEGIHFHNLYRDPNAAEFNPQIGPGNAVRLRFGSDHFRMQGNRFEYFVSAVDINSCDPRPEYANSDRIVLCGNHILNQWQYSSASHSQGVYGSCLRDMEIVGNVFEHNGWLDPELVPGSHPTQFNHNIYLGGINDGVRIAENFLSYPSSMAIKVRTDTTRGFRNLEIRDNVALRAPICVSMGVGFDDGVQPAPHYSNVAIEGNYCTERGDDFPGEQYAMRGLNVQSGENVVVRNNRLFHANSLFEGFGIRLIGEHINLLVEFNRIYAFRFYGILNEGATGSITVRSNEVQQPGEPLTPDQAQRTVARYNELTGGDASVEDFLARLRAQQYESWDARLTVPALKYYIEGGGER